MNRLSTLLIAFLVVSSVLGAGSMAGFATAQQSGETTEIDSCTTITKSGTYLLTEDIENSEAEACISIETSDVVLDGDGHTIDGTDTEGTVGIRAEFADSVTVRDVTVSDWTTGIEYQSDADDGTVTDVTVTSNLVGIGVHDASNVTVTDSEALDNEGIGVDFFVSAENTVRDTVASDNGGPGLSFADSSSNTVRNVTATDNDGAGFVFEESAGNTVTNVVATGNQQGFDFSLVGNMTIENARVMNNEGVAFESDSVLGQSRETNTARNVETGSATISFTEIKDTSSFTHELAIDAVESAPDDPGDRSNVGQYIDITESAPNATPSVELDVQYDDSDIEEAGVTEESLRLYIYADGEWTEVPDSSVDTEANVVSGNLTDVNDESVVVAPLGRPADEGDDAGDGGDGDSETSDGDNSPADATALALGETVGDSVGPDDEADWYAVDLDAGQTISVTGTDEASDTTLTAYGPPADDPETVERSDLTEIDSQGLTITEQTLVEFTAEENGTYYFAVTDDENDGDEPIDAYEFTVTAVNDPEESDDPEEGDDRDEDDDSENGDGSDGSDGDQRDADERDDGADEQNGSDDGAGDDGEQGTDEAPSGNGDDADEESDGSGGDGTETDDREGDAALFGEPITVEFAGITLTFGPPADPDDDGVYEDVTGDGEVDLFDAFAHAAVLTAVNDGAIDLSDEQASALDIDDDGTLTYGDALTLASGTSTS
jgi:parallel beta-helix repeat protein